MKIFDFFKRSRCARIIGIVLFVSVMLFISVRSIANLPGTVNNQALVSFLDFFTFAFAISSVLSACGLVFFPLKAKFGIFKAIFIIIFSLEAIGLMTGALILAISLDPANLLFDLSLMMSYYYYFLGLMIMISSVLCAIATSAVLVICLITRHAIRSKKNK